MKNIATVLFIHLSFILFSQEITENCYSTLIIEEFDDKTVLVDSVYIDTLIMNDESELRFTKNCLFIVENAYIGERCLLSSSGKKINLKNSKDFSIDGRDLTLFVVFRSLGSLKIDTSGGDGRNGKNGKNGLDGKSGTISMNNGGNGSEGQNGHQGGKGGNLRLHYLSEGFIANFNQSSNLLKHSIFVNVEGGRGGRGGRGGKGGKRGLAKSRIDYSQKENGVVGVIGITGQDGFDGQDGLSGKDGKDGLLIIKKMSSLDL